MTEGPMAQETQMGPVETWIRRRFDLAMDGSGDVADKAREIDAQLAAQQQRIADLEAALETARRWLVFHGLHPRSCPHSEPMWGQARKACNCGLDDLTLTPQATLEEGRCRCGHLKSSHYFGDRVMATPCDQDDGCRNYGEEGR